MDLAGDLSWKHSFSVMWLTYMLGCGASPEQQTELQTRNEWVTAKKGREPRFETTKLEWARKLGEAELSVLDDPLARYAQMGMGDLPPGAKVLDHAQFLAEAKAELAKMKIEGDEAKKQLERLDGQYPADKGAVVKMPENARKMYWSDLVWYPNRVAPDEDVKGLARLKGHLQQGQWLVKFRKILRKDEMTDDLVLVPVEKGTEQEYLRIMPTSPP
jgi:hypothetical protein